MLYHVFASCCLIGLFRSCWLGFFFFFSIVIPRDFGADVNLGMYLSKWEYHGTGYVSTITAVVVHTIGSSWNLRGDLLYLTC